MSLSHFHPAHFDDYTHDLCVQYIERSFLFLSPTLVYGREVSKSSLDYTKYLIEVKVSCTCFPSFRSVWEFHVSYAAQYKQLQFFGREVWMRKMSATFKTSRWISQQNTAVIKLYQLSELWGACPKYNSLKKYFRCSLFMQNERRWWE